MLGRRFLALDTPMVFEVVTDARTGRPLIQPLDAHMAVLTAAYAMLKCASLYAAL